MIRWRRSRWWQTRALVPVLVVCLASVSACTDSGDSDQAVQPFGTGEDFSVVAALGQVPLDVGFEDSVVALEIVDLRAAGLINGFLVLDEPSDPSGSSVSYSLLPGGYKPLIHAPPPVRMRGDPVAYKEEIGFGVLDVGVSINAGVRPPDQFAVLSGDLQLATTVEVADGVFTFGEGEDYSPDVLSRTEARPLGRPLRVGSNDGLVVMSSSTESVSAWLDPDVVRYDSIPSLVLAAEALDRRNVLSAFLLQRDFSAEHVEDLGLESEEVLEVPISAPFDTVGLGWSVKDGVGVVTVVYVFDDEVAANEMAPIVKNVFATFVDLGTGQPLSEGLIVDTVETEGQAVVASLRLVPGVDPVVSGVHDPGFIYHLFLVWHTPFLYRLDVN